ncbi:hypothetical protein BGZ93_003445, partial [Podila epicladia]
WELLAKQPAREIFYNPTLNPNSYMCAATDDGAFMILSDEYHSDEKYGDFTGAILDASTSNEWETVKFAKGLCLQRESTLEERPRLTFLTHKTGINLFVEQPTAFDVQRSNKRGDNFEFLGNQFVQLSFAWPEGNTTNVYNTTITSQLFDLDSQGLPDPTRQVSNATLTNLECSMENRGTHSGTSNGILYFFNKHTLYSWDGRGALNKIRDFKHIGGMDFSYTPVPAREGNESWSVVLADYDNFDMGLFGLGGLPKTAYWQSNKPAKVSATGLPADLSTGGIVGIAIGTVTLVVITGIAVRNWRHRLKNKKCDIELSKIGSRKDPVDRLTRE